jgi:hypothetical protein
MGCLFDPTFECHVTEPMRYRSRGAGSRGDPLGRAVARPGTAVVIDDHASISSESKFHPFQQRLRPFFGVLEIV